MNHRPDYVSFEPNARDELLSQIGNLSPLERDLFHRLCENWAPVIDRAGFLAKLGASPKEISALDHLMKKLRSAELGVVTTSVVSEKRVPTGLALTVKGSLKFHMLLLEEETKAITEKGFRVLPYTDRLAERGAAPPDYHVTDADPATLVDTYLAKDPEDSILRVQLLGDHVILATGRAIRSLIGSVFRWLRKHLEERGFLEELARIKATSLMDIKNRTREKAPDVWLDLTKTLVEERTEISYRKSTDEDDEIFQAAFLLMNFTEARMGAARKKQENESQVDQELALIADAVAKAPGGLMDAEEFDRRATEAESRLGHAASLFRGRLASVLMTPRPRRKLPVVTFVASKYVHRDNLRSVFERGRIACAEQLRGEYSDLMEAFLRGRVPDAGDIFASRGDLDQDIRGRISRLNPLISDLITRAQLLAEAVIRDAKRKNEAITTDALKVQLGVYFNVKDSALLPPVELFDINIVELFDNAFSRVNVIRQLFLRLSGRHDSLRRTYLRRFGTGGQRLSFADDAAGGAPGGGRTRTEKQDVPGIRVRGTGNRESEPDITTPARRRRTAIPPKPRVRSPREVERAWQNFGEALHAKGVDSEDAPSE